MAIEVFDAFADGVCRVAAKVLQLAQALKHVGDLARSNIVEQRGHPSDALLLLCWRLAALQGSAHSPEMGCGVVPIENFDDPS